jgi:hypothetical protein
MWNARVKRAHQLAAQYPAAREVLTFYSRLLGVQGEIYESLRRRQGWLPCGELKQDLSTLRVMLSQLLTVVEANGPESLAIEAGILLQANESEIDRLLLDYWRSARETQFFAKAFLQPYAQWLIEVSALNGRLAREWRAPPPLLDMPERLAISSGSLCQLWRRETCHAWILHGAGI